LRRHRARLRLALGLALAGAGALTPTASEAAEVRSPSGGGSEAATMPSPEELEALWKKVEAAPRPLVRFGEKAAAAGTASGAAAAPAGSAGGAAATSSAISTSGGVGGGEAAVVAPPRENILHGSLTLGAFASFDQTEDAPDRSYAAPRGSAAVSVDRIGGESLSFRFRGDARIILQDQARKDRTGATLDERIYLTELSLTYAGETNPLRASVGRTFAAPAAQAGLVDGGRAGIGIGGFEVGGFGGLDAAPDLSDQGRLKWGGYLAFETPASRAWSYRGAVALVSTTNDGDLDRRFFAIDQRLFLGSWLTLMNLVEADLYGGTANPLDRPSIDLTDVYAAARVRPLRWLDLGVSYDRRRAFFGAQEAEDISPATIEFIATDPYTSLRGDARVALPRACWIRGWGDRRLGAGDGLSAGAEAGCDAVLDTSVRLSGGASFTDTSYITGYSLFGRAGVTLVDGLLDGSIAYALRVDRYVDDDAGGDVLRHEALASLEFYFTRNLSAILEGGFETGDEVMRETLLVAVTYRF